MMRYLISTILAVITLVAPGQTAGPAIEMDGTSDYISMGTDSDLAVSTTQGRSFLLDFKADSYGGTLVSRYVNFNTGSSSFYISINSLGKIAVAGNGANAIQSTNTVALNQWQRLAVTVSASGQAKIYIDGVSNGSGTITLNSSIPAQEFTIGTLNTTATANRFDGTLDNLVVWDGEMTATEVSTYSSCLPYASNTDVIGKWSFEEQTGTTTADSAGTASGTLSSSNLWSNDTSTIVCTNQFGLNPPVFDYQVLVYPNPTNNILFVDIPQNMIGQQYSLEIVNAIGQSMYGSILNQQQLQINLNSFASAGTYTLQIKDSGGIVVNTKVIILQ